MVVWDGFGVEVEEEGATAVCESFAEVGFDVLPGAGLCAEAAIGFDAAAVGFGVRGVCNFVAECG